jgi:gamma-glutamyl:cysteine ligase YbdK (ATP-grasp superfamily)
MKETYFLYGVAILAVVGILVCFIGYATNTLPMHTQKQAPLITTSPTAKKKNCACCVEETADIVKAIRQNREKMLAHQQKYTQATKIITQYGLEEGLRKLKQSDPEIAAQFERILLKHPADSKNVESSP